MSCGTFGTAIQTFGLPEQVSGHKRWNMHNDERRYAAQHNVNEQEKLADVVPVVRVMWPACLGRESRREPGEMVN